MKKDLKSKSKRKWIVGGVLLFGGVALLTTGFATWAIGVNQTKQNLGTNVTVEGTVNESVKLTITPVDMGINVSEKHSLTGNEIFYTKNDAAETDFTVNVNVKLEIGADYYEKNLSNINKIQFTFIDSWGESTPEVYNSDKDKTTARKITVSSESPSVGKTHKAEDYEYITISTSSSLTIPTLNEGHTAIASEAANPVGFTYSGSKTGSKVFTKESLDIKLFDWGSYFDSKSPCTYYNKLYNDSEYRAAKGLGITDAAGDIDLVYNEMNAMKNAMQPDDTETNIYVAAALV